MCGQLELYMRNADCGCSNVRNDGQAKYTPRYKYTQCGYEHIKHSTDVNLLTQMR